MGGVIQGVVLSWGWFFTPETEKRPINTNMEVRGTLVFLEMVYVYC